jgi:hypothetical protein
MSHPESLDDATRRRWWYARAEATWPQVHVVHTEVAPTPCGRRVRAAVRLGGLAPVDVIVELQPFAAPPGVGAGVERMWSTESLDNGTVVFEAHLGAATTAADDAWVLSVRPAEAVRARPVDHPLDLRPARRDAPRARE